MIRHLMCLCLTLLAAACADVKSSIPDASAAVPSALVGEWTGSWTATSGGQSGAIELRVQEFAGQAVVQVDTDLPCLSAAVFTLRFSATSFTATVGGAQVLDGTLVAAGQLQGGFSCAAAQGTWQATKVRTLPAVTDLSGTWTGALYIQGQTPQPFTLELQMTLDAGVLRLDGVLAVQGSPTEPIIGYANEFDDQGYAVYFRTVADTLRATGNGSYGPLRIEMGQWGAFAAGTAIGGGVFSMERQAP